jgi:hypothetical protein
MEHDYIGDAFSLSVWHGSLVQVSPGTCIRMPVGTHDTAEKGSFLLQSQTPCQVYHGLPEVPSRVKYFIKSRSCFVGIVSNLLHMMPELHSQLARKSRQKRCLVASYKSRNNWLLVVLSTK